LVSDSQSTIANRKPTVLRVVASLRFAAHGTRFYCASLLELGVRFAGEYNACTGIGARYGTE